MSPWEKRCPGPHIVDQYSIDSWPLGPLFSVSFSVNAVIGSCTESAFSRAFGAYAWKRSPPKPRLWVSSDRAVHGKIRQHTGVSVMDDSMYRRFFLEPKP